MTRLTKASPCDVRMCSTFQLIMTVYGRAICDKSDRTLSLFNITPRRRIRSYRARRAKVHLLSTRGIWKVMHIHPYNFTQWSEKNDEGISVNVRIWGVWRYHVLMFALMQ